MKRYLGRLSGEGEEDTSDTAEGQRQHRGEDGKDAKDKKSGKSKFKKMVITIQFFFYTYTAQSYWVTVDPRQPVPTSICIHVESMKTVKYSFVPFQRKG